MVASRLEEGISLQRQGKLADARSYYRAILSQAPDDGAALHYLGLAEYQAGDLDSADRLMTRSLEVDPCCANTWSDLGAVKLEARKPEESIQHFARALTLNDRHTDAMNNMATALRQLRRFDQAIVFLRRLASLRPDSAEAVRSLADALYDASKVNEAVELYHEAIRLDPNNLSGRLGMAEACEAVGKFKQARMQYLAVLRREPNNPLALTKLLQLRDGATDEGWVLKATHLSEATGTDIVARERLSIGLAYYYDRAKAYDVAFRHLKVARDQQARSRPFDSAGYSNAVDMLIQVLTKDFFQLAPTSGFQTSRPLFVVGMPRSGTTLTEQILATHSGVAAGGELSALPRASYQVLELSADHSPYPHGLRSISEKSLEMLARGYLDELDKLYPDTRKVTDKLPFNFMHLAVAALMFPRAKIVHCRRHPMDNCLSCFFTSFAGEVQFTSDLETLGRYYADYHRLMQHWNVTLPIRIFDLHYEKLVSNPESTIRELLDYCELGWEGSCLQFYATEREIRTPSRWQVRQPIYQNSVARWRHYEKYLDPLKRGLGALLSTSSP